MPYVLKNQRKQTVNLLALDENTLANVEAIQQGEYTICCNKTELENLLECFPAEDFERLIHHSATKTKASYDEKYLQYGTKDWMIVDLSNGMIGVLPKNCKPSQKKEFSEMIKE